MPRDDRRVENFSAHKRHGSDVPVTIEFDDGKPHPLAVRFPLTHKRFPDVPFTEDYAVMAVYIEEALEEALSEDERKPRYCERCGHVLKVDFT